MDNSTIALRFLRYASIGIATNFAGYLIYLLVTWLGVAPKSAMSILYLVGASLGYFGNRQWAFRYSGSVWWSSLKYLALHITGYALNYLMLYIFADKFGLPHQLVQAVAVIVVACYLFVGFDLIVFRTKNSEGSAT